MALLDIIRQASIDSIDRAQPAAFIFATVTKISPLTVSVEGRFTISEPLLIVPESLRTYRIANVTGFLQGSTTNTVSSGELYLSRLFNVGDELLLARIQGGQRYVVLDRLKEKRWQ